MQTSPNPHRSLLQKHDNAPLTHARAPHTPQRGTEVPAGLGICARDSQSQPISHPHQHAQDQRPAPGKASSTSKPTDAANARSTAIVEDATKPAGQTWTLVLRAVPDPVPAICRLRRFLKGALRGYGLRCERIEETRDPEFASLGDVAADVLRGIAAATPRALEGDDSTATHATTPPAALTPPRASRGNADPSTSTAGESGRNPMNACPPRSTIAPLPSPHPPAPMRRASDGRKPTTSRAMQAE